MKKARNGLPQSIAKLIKKNWEGRESIGIEMVIARDTDKMIDLEKGVGGCLQLHLCSIYLSIP